MRRHLFSFLSLCVSLSASLTPSLSLSLSLSLSHSNYDTRSEKNERVWGRLVKGMFERFDKICFVFQSSFFSNKNTFKARHFEAVQKNSFV